MVEAVGGLGRAVLARAMGCAEALRRAGQCLGRAGNESRDAGRHGDAVHGPFLKALAAVPMVLGRDSVTMFAVNHEES